MRQAATTAHDAAQGVRGSGADVLAATFGGLCILNSPKALADGSGAAAPQLPARLCFVATPTSVATAGLVARYRESGAANQAATQALAAAAERFLQAVWDQSFAELAAAVAQAYAALRQGLVAIEVSGTGGHQGVPEGRLHPRDHAPVAEGVG